MFVCRGITAEEATEDIITNQIPEIQRRRLNREFHVHNIDVFCEKGVYNVEQSKMILKAGMDIGLAVNFHAEELNLLHSAEVKDAKSIEIFSNLSNKCYY